MIRFKFFRLLTRKTRLLLLSRLIIKNSLNEISAINILLYYNYSSNEKIRE